MVIWEPARVVAAYWMDSASSRGIRNVEVQPAPRISTCTVSNGFDVLTVLGGTTEGIGMSTSIGPGIVILMVNVLFQETVGNVGGGLKLPGPPELVTFRRVNRAIN